MGDANTSKANQQAHAPHKSTTARTRNKLQMIGSACARPNAHSFLQLPIICTNLCHVKIRAPRLRSKRIPEPAKTFSEIWSEKPSEPWSEIASETGSDTGSETSSDTCSERFRKVLKGSETFWKGLRSRFRYTLEAGSDTPSNQVAKQTRNTFRNTSWPKGWIHLWSHVCNILLRRSAVSEMAPWVLHAAWIETLNTYDRTQKMFRRGPVRAQHQCLFVLSTFTQRSSNVQSSASLFWGCFVIRYLLEARWMHASCDRPTLAHKSTLAARPRLQTRTRTHEKQNLKNHRKCRIGSDTIFRILFSA